ncbi:MAG: Uxx-star family glutaredoxin-like (seleno)protein [Candidatus Spechtbacteria bacterium]|nr:Uxx-star family glutaredoxin-like (seleno)protein [Candidatus Spechtbacteria bacterium]
MEKQVTIYTTPTCHYCHMAKEFFQENNVEYIEHDVAKDMKAREEMVQMSGQMGVPVIQVGDEIIVGFNKEALQEMLGIK